MTAHLLLFPTYYFTLKSYHQKRNCSVCWWCQLLRTVFVASLTRKTHFSFFFVHCVVYYSYLSSKTCRDWIQLFGRKDKTHCFSLTWVFPNNPDTSSHSDASVHRKKQLVLDLNSDRALSPFPPVLSSLFFTLVYTFWTWQTSRSKWFFTWQPWQAWLWYCVLEFYLWEKQVTWRIKHPIHIRDKMSYTNSSVARGAERGSLVSTNPDILKKCHRRHKNIKT